MKTLFKGLLWLLGLTVILVAVAAVVVPIYVDPNDFKGPIARQLEGRLGRTVEIQGDISLSVFPWLGLEVGRVTLGSPPGFAEPTFASVEQADVRVKLLPLLRREVEMDTVSVRGLDLRLVRDRTGRTSWEGLPGAGEAAAAATPPAEAAARPGLAALAVGGLAVQDARVRWRDEASGQELTVEDLDLRTGAIASGQPVPVQASAQVRSGTPETTVDVGLEGRLEVDLERSVYRMRELALQARAAGARLPGQGADLELRGQADLDLAQQTLKAVPLRLKALGIEAELSVVVEAIQTAPRYNAALDTRDVDLRAVLGRLGAGPIATADPGALTRAALETRVSGTAESASLSPFVLRLDGSTVEGRVTLASFAGPAVRFDLQADHLDLDRYLPPPARPVSGDAAPAPVAPASPAAAAGVASALPLDLLRGLDLDGRLRVDALKAGGLRASDVSLTVTAKDGVITVDPAEAQLYGGTYAGRSRLDVRGDRPLFRVNEQLTRVQAGPLLKDLLGEARVSGVADATLRLEFSGEDARAIRRTVTGDGRFSVRDGAVAGVNLGRLLRQGEALVEGRAPPAEEGPVETDFSELRGTLQVTQGVVRNEDLQAKSPALRVEGRGSADLVRDQLDYLLTVHVVGTAKGQDGRELEKLRGVAVPVRVTGPLAAPRYRVELDDALKARAKDEAERRLEREIEKKLGPEGAEKAKELLRGLFR
jgi:AsmA protein